MEPVLITNKALQEYVEALAELGPDISEPAVSLFCELPESMEGYSPDQVRDYVARCRPFLAQLGIALTPETQEAVLECSFPLMKPESLLALGQELGTAPETWEKIFEQVMAESDPEVCLTADDLSQLKSMYGTLGIAWKGLESPGFVHALLVAPCEKDDHLRRPEHLNEILNDLEIPLLPLAKRAHELGIRQRIGGPHEHASLIAAAYLQEALVVGKNAAAVQKELRENNFTDANTWLSWKQVLAAIQEARDNVDSYLISDAELAHFTIAGQPLRKLAKE